jgi:hypothetical protein
MIATSPWGLVKILLELLEVEAGCDGRHHSRRDRSGFSKRDAETQRDRWRLEFRDEVLRVRQPRRGPHDLLRASRGSPVPSLFNRGGKRRAILGIKDSEARLCGADHNKLA